MIKPKVVNITSRMVIPGVKSSSNSKPVVYTQDPIDPELLNTCITDFNDNSKQLVREIQDSLGEAEAICHHFHAENLPKHFFLANVNTLEYFKYKDNETKLFHVLPSGVNTIGLMGSWIVDYHKADDWLIIEMKPNASNRGINLNFFTPTNRLNTLLSFSLSGKHHGISYYANKLGLKYGEAFKDIYHLYQLSKEQHISCWETQV